MGGDAGHAASRPTRCAARVDNAAEAGADEFFLVPTTVDPDELARTDDALGDLHWRRR